MPAHEVAPLLLLGSRPPPRCGETGTPRRNNESEVPQRRRDAEKKPYKENHSASQRLCGKIVPGPKTNSGSTGLTACIFSGFEASTRWGTAPLCTRRNLWSCGSFRWCAHQGVSQLSDCHHHRWHTFHPSVGFTVAQLGPPSLPFPGKRASSNSFVDACSIISHVIPPRGTLRRRLQQESN